MYPPSNVEIRVRYFTEDTEFKWDYSEVVLTMHWESGFVDTRTWGDAYHDRGLEKCEAFCDALIYLNPQLVVTRLDIADFEG